jgi:hypothetical protein
VRADYDGTIRWERTQVYAAKREEKGRGPKNFGGPQPTEGPREGEFRTGTESSTRYPLHNARIMMRTHHKAQEEHHDIRDKREGGAKETKEGARVKNHGLSVYFKHKSITSMLCTGDLLMCGPARVIPCTKSFLWRGDFPLIPEIRANPDEFPSNEPMLITHSHSLSKCSPLSLVPRSP